MEPWQPLLDAMDRLRQSWPGGDWSWDHRIKCVTSTIEAAEEPRARQAVLACLPQVWAADSLASAPDAVRALAEAKGGLRPGQLLFCGPPAEGMIAYGLWWPWGDRSRISGRFGVANSDRPKELFPLIRALFGIS